MITTMTATRDRIGWLDVAIAIACSALGVLLMYANITDPDIDASVLTIPVFLLVTVPVLWRSVAPLPALVAVLAALLLHSVLFGFVVRCGAAFPVVGFLTFSVAARSERRDALLGLAVAVAAILVTGAWEQLGFDVVSALLPLTLLAWGLGRLAHARGAMAAELRRRTEELRTARDERARMEVATERAQLSGELEALLQRRLGELATLAERGAALTDGGAATVVLTDIEQTGRRTLDDMRELVGVLRSDDGSAPVAPQPTLTSLEALLLQAKGTDAHLIVQGSPRVLPAAVELSAFRVVEHLLHALDDAPGVDVVVAFGDDALELTVAGPSASRRRAEASAALERARERVQLHRGRMRTSSHGGRAEMVVSLPVAAEA